MRDTREIAEVEQQGATMEAYLKVIQQCLVGYERWGKDKQCITNMLYDYSSQISILHCYVMLACLWQQCNINYVRPTNKMPISSAEVAIMVLK